MKNPIETEYAKYELAKLSFQECLGFIDLYSRFKDTFVDQDFWTFTIAIYRSVVVTYAKPFTDNNSVNGFGVGTISTKWLSRLEDQERRHHEFLVGEARNIFLAHVDLEKLTPNIWVKDGEHNDLVFDYPFPVFSAEHAPSYIKLIRTAYEYCGEHQKRIKPRLTTDHIIPMIIEK